MAPNLAAMGDKVALSWIEPAPTSTEDQPLRRVRVSLLEGGAWSDPVTVVEHKDIVANWADMPSLTIHPTGAMLIHWAQKSGEARYAYDVRLGLSQDGQSWKALGSPHKDGTPTEHGFVSIVAEGEGFRAFWLDGREAAAKPPGPTSLRTAQISGDSLGASEVIDGRICDCCGTGATLASGGPLVVFRDRDESELRDVSVVRRDGSGWSQPTNVHADGWKISGCPVNGPVVTGEGKDLAVVWFTGAGGQSSVRAAFSNDGGASFSKPVDVDSGEGNDSPMGRVAALGLEDGGALVSWLDGEGEGAVIRAVRVSASGQLGVPVDVAPSSRSRASGFVKMARLGEDSVLFVWTVADKPTSIKGLKIPLAEWPPPEASQ